MWNDPEMSRDAPRSAADMPSLASLRVCIVAEHASFRFGGEASLPLHYFSRLRARRIEAWLIVHGRTQQELEALFPDDQDRIQYIPDRWYHKLIWRLSARLPRRISEATFGVLMVLINQLSQRGLVRKLIRVQGINVVHQPIPVSPKAPSFIWGLGAPVVIGPMNGGMNYPEAFRGDESSLTRVSVWLGRLSAGLLNRLIAGKRYASVLLVANERTRAALPVGRRARILELPENGVDLAVWSPQVETTERLETPRFLFIGRLVDWKRLDFLLHALMECPDATLDVIGDGPMREIWERTAKRLGVHERVHWLGWLSQPECAKRLQGATALVLPSIYECGGAVVLEAMACAVPVVALAWGGPAEYIDSSCGILIAPSDSDSIIRGFVDAQRTLGTNPHMRAQLGNAGRKRVELLFDWNRKIDQMLDIYRASVAEFRP
jgi:glycosyltransferase involved in cell wall biosynthesis